MKTEALPQTDSIQELAQYWETHDVTDFEDELEEVTECIFETTYSDSAEFGIGRRLLTTLRVYTNWKIMGAKDLK